MAVTVLPWQVLVHRIAADMWSLMVLLDDLRILYADAPSAAAAAADPTVLSSSVGSTVPLPPVPTGRVVEYREWLTKTLPGSAEGDRLAGCGDPTGIARSIQCFSAALAAAQADKAQGPLLASCLLRRAKAHAKIMQPKHCRSRLFGRIA